MGRIKRKFKSGIATMYISRTQAVKKLQLPLKDFQRLCILKGVYPREPSSRRKAGKGNLAAKTYYHTKDILFLSHEPLIKKFREFKVFAKKLKTAVAKRETAQQERLESRMPVVSLNHIVKERYPNFTDAVRDLDDAMCMLFLFADMPTTHKVGPERIQKCKLLMDEFLQYVVKARALKKVFLSIKGIYFQAEVMGQPITWITPYKFAQKTPTDVDFRIMDTFLHFYTTLVGFVNCRLYTTLNLRYPPKVDGARAKDDAGMSAFVLEKATAGEAAATEPAAQENMFGEKVLKATAKQVKNLSKVIGKIEATVFAEESANASTDGTAATAGEGGGSELDAFPVQMAGGEDTVAEIAAKSGEEREAAEFEKLFDGSWFFLGREVPKVAVEFACRAFGGKVSWQGLGDGTEGEVVGRGPYTEEDARITHQIVDRPALANMKPERHYVQPQWVFDCINARRVLPTAPYTVGAVLPPHLSPFEVPEDDGYVPPEAQEGKSALASLDDDGEEVDDSEEDSEEDEEEDEPEDEEELYRQELAAEAAGEVINEKSAAVQKKKAAKKAKEQLKTDEEERKELAISLMPKKHAKLYGKIMYGKAKKQAETDKLRAKRKAHDESTTNKKKAKKSSK